jgi:uncharacterized OsmC-like protein
MTADELRALQAPLKARYREDPLAADVTMRAMGRLHPGRLMCEVERTGPIKAGLHRAAGGDGSLACSGDLLLESLVACAGVTACVVATALGIQLEGGVVTAVGHVDFRGTLGVSKDVPVGFRDIELSFELDTKATTEELATLLKLTERYCVVAQSLRTPPSLTLKG